MKIAIIGCGNMGKALARRLSLSNELFLYNRDQEKALLLEQEGVGSAKSLVDALQLADIVILAIKPQNLEQAAEEISPLLKKGQLVLSLLAGTALDALQRHFPDAHVVRMMPNLAVVHGEGAIGLSSNDELAKDGLEKALSSLGKLYWISESKMDAFTALTSSGPAFFFTMVEAMIESGIAMGFTSSESRRLVQQMLHGSLALLEKTSGHPSDLKWQIASPGGVTIAGLKKLEEEALKGRIMNTFLAAYERAGELSQKGKQRMKTF